MTLDFFMVYVYLYKVYILYICVGEFHINTELKKYEKISGNR